MPTIYKTQVYDKDHGAVLSWHPSEVKAKQELARVRKERGSKSAPGPEGVSTEVIPANKAGLIEWLNANVKRDNG